MKNIKTNLSLLLITFAIACSSPQKKDLSSKFNQMLEDYYQEGLKLNPLMATRLGDNRYNNLFPDFLSDNYMEKEKEFYSRYLEKANSYNDLVLSEDEKISKEILIWQCEDQIKSYEFHDDYLPINQMFSVNLLIAQWASGKGAQPFATVEDYKNWIQRIDGYLAWMASAEKKMREGIKHEYVLPKSLIIKVIPQLEYMITDKPEDHLFYSPVINIPESFTNEEKIKIKQEYIKMVEQDIIPAYKKLLQFVSTDYLAAGRETSGFNALPDGEANYAHRIKSFTTTSMTADEIFQLGLNEVARIRSEMEQVKKQVGFEGDLNSFFNHVRNNKELMPFTDPQQVIDNFNSIHERMKPQLAKLFNKAPKAGFEVRRIESFREKSASAHYNISATDGSRPGIFYVPIPDVTSYNTFTDESLFLHEAIPGHHYQLALSQENENLPKFRKLSWFNAYGEGWALYTESLGKELGLYEDPYQYFGMLSAEMHRAIRLVVDAGIHSKGWSREKAIQYSLENEAEPESSIISEIERYMAMPGQALGYKIGQLKILELRQKAEKELGNNFDVREFHDQVLDSGGLPLSVLESKINNWIADKKS